jgi:O-antigen/teichoic acid export membrane protein
MLLSLRENWKAMAAIFLGRAGVALAQIIIVRISTELLSPAQLGGISQLGSLAWFFCIVFTVPVGMYITRGFLEWNDAGILRDYLRRYLVYILVATFVAAILSGSIQMRWQLISGFSAVSVVLLISIYMFSSPVSALGTTGLNLVNQRIQFAFFSNVPVWIALGISPVLFRRYSDPAFWIFGQYIGLSIACLSCWALWRYLRTSISVSELTPRKVMPFNFFSIFHFSWPVMIASVMWWMQSQSYKFVLDRIHGIDNVGLFTVGYSMVIVPIGIYEGLFGQFYQPFFFRELKGQNMQGVANAWNNYARAYLPGLAVFGVYVAAGAPFLARVLLGEAFRNVAIHVALLGVIIEIMRAAGGMISHLGVAKVDNRITILPTVVGALLAPTGVYFLGRFEPIIGTVVGLFIAGFVVIVIIIITSRRALPIVWPVRRIVTGFLLSVPLAVGLHIASQLIPEPGTVVSLFVLVIGGAYVLVIQAWLFAYREKT